MAAPQRPDSHPAPRPGPVLHLRAAYDQEPSLGPGQWLLAACSLPQFLLCLDKGSANFSEKGLNAALFH